MARLLVFEENVLLLNVVLEYLWLHTRTDNIAENVAPPTSSTNPRKPTKFALLSVLLINVLTLGFANNLKFFFFHNSFNGKHGLDEN